MAEDPTSAKNATPVPGIKRAQTVDESMRLRRRLSRNAPSDPAMEGVPEIRRRRSSNFSDFSLNEARKNFRNSTDDLLLPTPTHPQLQVKHESSHWDSAPLAFALLPAIGGMLFKNGSSVITDITLLGLAAIFLNWSVRIPW